MKLNFQQEVLCLPASILNQSDADATKLRVLLWLASDLSLCTKIRQLAKLAECDTKKKAERLVLDRLDGIEEVADGVLKVNGFTYKSSAKIKNEQFPTRNWGSVCLETGYYDALILELGSGKGDNWWCVVYPPLCFTGESVKYEYRSKIKDIIDEFIQKKENRVE